MYTRKSETLRAKFACITTDIHYRHIRVAEDLLSCNLYVGVVPILQFFRWCCSWEPYAGQSWSFSNTILCGSIKNNNNTRIREFKVTSTYFETSLQFDVQLLENYLLIFLHCWCSLFYFYFQYNIGRFTLKVFPDLILSKNEYKRFK